MTHYTVTYQTPRGAHVARTVEVGPALDKLLDGLRRPARVRDANWHIVGEIEDAPQLWDDRRRRWFWWYWKPDMEKKVDNAHP